MQASLLAGGIASLLHLFALTLRTINKQLNQLLEIEHQGDAYPELLAAAAAALLRYRAAPGAPTRRSLLAAFSAGCAARAMLRRLARRRAVARLNASQERLAVILQLWWLATSVLQARTVDALKLAR